jgi:hypothetical protein
MWAGGAASAGGAGQRSLRRALESGGAHGVLITAVDTAPKKARSDSPRRRRR